MCSEPRPHSLVSTYKSMRFYNPEDQPRRLCRREVPKSHTVLILILINTYLIILAFIFAKYIERQIFCCYRITGIELL